MSEPYSVQRLLGRFALVWVEDGKRRRIRLNATDRQSAEAEARLAWQASDAGAWTVGRIVTGYIQELVDDNKPSAPRRKDAWKAMKLFWDAVDPALIDKPMCRKYAGQRKAAESTIRYELLMISTACKWGREKKFTEATPTMWLPADGERKIRHLTHEQFETFYEAVKAPHARLYVLLGLYTMARPTAILDLTWDRVDFERGLVDLNPAGRRQTAKRRPIVPMSDDLREALEAAVKARQTSHVIERGAKRVHNMKKAFQAASERSGIHVTPYMLRHTGAVWAAEQGMSMTELAQFMGHDDDRTTQMHYARYSPEHLRKVANAVQRKKK